MAAYMRYSFGEDVRREKMYRVCDVPSHFASSVTTRFAFARVCEREKVRVCEECRRFDLKWACSDVFGLSVT